MHIKWQVYYEIYLPDISVYSQISLAMKLRITIISIFICFGGILFSLQCVSKVLEKDAVQDSIKNTKSTTYLTVIFRDVHNSPVELLCEVAKTNAEKRKGLMFRSSLKKGTGMLFEWSYPQIVNFWMKSTYIPLSIAFINTNGVVTSIKTMQPLSKKLVPSNGLVQYVIETNQGWFKNNNIIPGSKISLKE